MHRQTAWQAFRLLLALASLLAASPLPAAIPAAPDRAEGDGPYPQLVLRGATLVDGTGAPPLGPVDIVIEGNRISAIRSVGAPGMPIDPEQRPAAEPGAREIDASGMTVLPGFVDTHAHMGGDEQGVDAEYVFKLWLGHGVTTIRDPSCGNGLEWCLQHRKRSADNAITAPRIHAYPAFGSGQDDPIITTEQARDWVRAVARQGAQGIKFFGASPVIMRAALAEAAEQGLRTTMHHAQLAVTGVNALDSARMGLNSMEHWYGLPEAMFEGQVVQDYPLDYNYNNEQHRFAEAGRLWVQAAAPGSKTWNRVRDELIALDFTLSPTLTIYEASRDLMKEQRAVWHDEYTHPALWQFFQPSRVAHGSYWFDWTTADEVAWKRNYVRWMQFLNDYKNHGGRVTTGSDSGYIYKVYGFGYIRELELLQEAGFHPLEVLRSATLLGAEALGVDTQVGSVAVGKLADLVLVEGNPLRNFKLLYGTGHELLDEQNRLRRVGGVRYTIKDGIVYDAPRLLADVRRKVAAAKSELASNGE